MEDEPQRVTAQDVTGLRTDTRYLADSIDKLAERQATTETKVEAKADDKKVNNVRAVAVLALVAVVIALLSAVVGWRNNSARLDEINQQQRQAEAAKVVARRSACADANKIIDAHDVFVLQVRDEHQTFLDAAKANTTSTPEQRERSIKFFEDEIATYQSSVLPYRDCSTDDAINAFYASGGKQGLLPLGQKPGG